MPLTKQEEMIILEKSRDSIDAHYGIDIDNCERQLQEKIDAKRRALSKINAQIEALDPETVLRKMRHKVFAILERRGFQNAFLASFPPNPDIHQFSEILAKELVQS